MERRHTVCQYGYTIRAIFASGGSDPVCGAPVSRKDCMQVVLQSAGGRAPAPIQARRSWTPVDVLKQIRRKENPTCPTP